MAIQKLLVKERTICELFLDHVEKAPNSMALDFDEQILSYEQLDEKSDKLVRYITEQYGQRTNQAFKRGSLIALFLDESVEVVVGLLAILKVGAAYMLIDSRYSKEQIDQMLTDAKIVFVLGQRNAKYRYERLPMYKMLYIDLSEDLYRKKYTSPLLYNSSKEHEVLGKLLSEMNVFPLDESDHLLITDLTSLDIPLLLWSLTKGSTISLRQKRGNHHAPKMDFSLFYFSSQQQEDEDNKYQFLKESAIYADRHGFSAIWLPERHFHKFGGIFPNPSVLAAAIASITETIEIRCGSIVLPLHDVIRAAEEWSVVDNLSGGRIAMSVASGWHANDFVLKPENYSCRHSIMYRQIEELRILWQGDSLKRINGQGQEIDIKIFPKPVTSNPSIYITSAGSTETFVNAGKIGANILTHLLGQDINVLRKNIELYRNALKENGFLVEDAKVALMLHTYIGTDLDEVKSIVKEPLKLYLKSSAGLLQSFAKEFDVNASNLSGKELDDLLEFAFERYWRTAAMLGTINSCNELISSVAQIGVTEIACLVDFGIENNFVVNGLTHLNELKNNYRKNKPSGSQNPKPVTIVQANLSHFDTLLNDDNSPALLASLKHVVLQGDNVSPGTLGKLSVLSGADVYTMHGSIETNSIILTRRNERVKIV